MYNIKFSLVSLFFIFCVALSPVYAIQDVNFPIPPSFEKRVDFWKKIYTEVDGNEGFIHDTEDFFIYEKIKILHEGQRKKNKAITKNAKETIKKRLLIMAQKKPEEMNVEEKQLFERLGNPSPESLKERAEQIRFQKGQQDKYYQGLIRSQLYLDYIKNEFKEAGLPERLAYLPHVESSFNYQAYSKVGAAGIWQFMRSTGRLYMRLNYQIDERRDPIASTRGAIKLLKSNYERLGAWPLAVTAYNHGPESIARAIEKLNTRDIEKIIDDYKARRFKFASKNFYACFLAASEIAMAPEKYFKNIPKPTALTFAEIKLNQQFTIREILEITKLSEKTFKDYNLSLRPMAFKKNLALPVGFIVKIPSVDKPAITALEEHVVKGARPSPAPGPVTLAQATVVATSASQALITPQPTPAAGPTIALASSKKVEEDEIKIQTHYNFKLKQVRKGVFQIQAQHSESLTMLSDWLEVPLNHLAKINRLKVSSDLSLGQKILIPLKKTKIEDFKKKREEFHLSVEEDFFDNYKIIEIKKYAVKRGDTIAALADRFDVPPWLIYQIQKKDLHSIYPKQVISLPVIQARVEQEAPVIPGNNLNEEEVEEESDFNPN